MSRVEPDTDPFALEVIKDSLQAICDEMFAAMRKTAMSPLIYEVLDFGVGLLTAEGELACQGSGIPIFVGALEPGIQELLKKYPVPEICPGDVFITNDPYAAGTHLNDVALGMPVFVDAKLVAWVANKAHWSDIGGMVPGGLSPRSTSIFQEGLQFSNTRLFARGSPVASILDLIQANSRIPERTMGDMWAGIAALHVGEKRVQALAGKYGVDRIAGAFAAILRDGETLARRALATTPHGEFIAESEMDPTARGGAKRPIRVRVKVSADEFLVDLRGNPPQTTDCPFNCTAAMTRIAAQMAFMAITAPESRANAGSFRPLRVLCDPGSVFAAVRPTAVGLYAEPLLHAVDLICKALVEHVPSRLGAGTFASVCAIIIVTRNPDSGEFQVTVDPEPGGWGAAAGQDGESAVFSPINGETHNVPVEICESVYGYRVRRYALNTAAGGDGTFRGGCGVVLEYEVRASEGSLTPVFNRTFCPPWGVAGGSVGGGNYVLLIRDGVEVQYSREPEIDLRPDDLIRVVTSSGGGFGDPSKRERWRVALDVKNEYVTRECARTLYGWSDSDADRHEAGDRELQVSRPARRGNRRRAD